MRLIPIFVVALMFVTTSVSSAKDARLEYVKKQLVSSGIDKTEIDKLLADKRLKLYPLKVVAYKQPNWKIIERKLYSKISVQRGKSYIKNNQAAFDKAEQDFGVKKEVLAGIIAIETDFGKNSGNYPIFNVIYSRLERWPAAKWRGQANELIALSKFCLSSQLDCFKIRGSYAGAFGLVQFMPSSVLSCCSRFTICAWTETSSALSGSSQTSSRGLTMTARAIATRWHWPPLSSCGYRFMRSARSPTRANTLAISALSSERVSHG